MFCPCLNERVFIFVQLTPLRKDSSEHNATSPDLGIDSDPGRNNSFDFDVNPSFHSSKYSTKSYRPWE